jgi:hypothetical protein
MLIPPVGDDREGVSPRSGGIISVGAALLVAVSIVILEVFAGLPRTSPGLVIVSLIFVIVVGVYWWFMLLSRTAARKGKRIENLDMYSLINRLVKDLDDNELAYLERKVAERKQHPDTMLTEDVGALLQQRDEARRAGSD